MANTPRQTRKPKAGKPKKVTVLFHDRDLIGRIDDYATRTRRPSRSNAIEALVAEALDAATRAASA